MSMEGAWTVSGGRAFQSFTIRGKKKKFWSVQQAMLDILLWSYLQSHATSQKMIHLPHTSWGWTCCLWVRKILLGIWNESSKYSKQTSQNTENLSASLQTCNIDVTLYWHLKACKCLSKAFNFQKPKITQNPKHDMIFWTHQQMHPHSWNDSGHHDFMKQSAEQTFQRCMSPFNLKKKIYDDERPVPMTFSPKFLKLFF